MKIGVLTFHRAINIGGVLQAFALQHFLKENGCQSEIIDYRCPTIEKQYYGRQFDLKSMKRIVSAIIRNGVIKVNTSKFEDFHKHHLPISSRSYSPNNIETANEEYSKFVVGSDQIWSSYCAGFDKAYFLDFVRGSNEKYSYAASFGGSEIPQELTPSYRELLEDFSVISVRETAGAEIVKSVSAHDADVVLDPTLLLTESIWRKELITPITVTRPFVLVYMIAECKELLALARKIGEERNLDVIYISDRIYCPSGIISRRNVGPKDFLSLIDASEVVVTNSYHGICFSMIFKKDLYIGLLRRNTRVNARLLDVIRKYRLESRLVSSDSFSNGSVIDFKFITDTLVKEKKKSITWLRSLFDD